MWSDATAQCHKDWCDFMGEVMQAGQAHLVSDDRAEGGTRTGGYEPAADNGRFVGAECVVGREDVASLSKRDNDVAERAKAQPDELNHE